jgi:hypothetical protein
MQTKHPQSDSRTDAERAQEPQQEEPRPVAKPIIRVKTHIRAGDGGNRLFDSQNSDIRLKTGVETLEGVLEKLARLDVDLSDE